MSKELVISSNRHETRVAILEDDQLVEVYFQRANEYSLAGSIHKGRVTRVLPGMQSAFVDLGLERDTFLYVSDFFEENEEYDSIAGPADERASSQGARPDSRAEHRRPADRPFAERQPAERQSVDRQAIERQPVPAGPLPLAETLAASPDTQPATGAPPPGGDRQDGRGRRSRRRRTRGRGFPDSKYATDLGSDDAMATENVASAHSFSTPSFDEEESEPEAQAEIVLLPGETRAKFRRPFQEPEIPAQGGEQRAEKSEAATSAAAGPEDREDEREGGEKQQAADLATSAYVQSTATTEALAGFPESAYFVPQTPLMPLADPEADPELKSVPEAQWEAAVSELQAKPVATEVAVEADEESEVEALEEPNDILDAVEALDADPLDSQTLDSEAAGDDDGNESPEEEEEADEEVELGEPSSAVTEPSTDQPLRASVREQGASRYLHRGGRRPRRRGGRGGGPSSGSGPAPAAADTPVIEPLAAPVAPARSPSPQRQSADRPAMPSITELLREGQEIIVQIAKEPLGQKGARITSHIALPGRYVVYMPALEHLGVSRKIASDEERLRLKKILLAHRTGITGGYIVRTAGEGKTEDEIAADMAFLYNLWLDIRQKAEKKPAPLLLHHDLEIVQRILRDQLTDTFKAVWVDNEEMYESVLRFMQRFQPALVPRVKMYTRPTPVFDAFNITTELEKALRPKVWLKSGGYIVVNQTEALVAVDVNTGKYVGKSNRLEDTITKTNTEAVKEIVRQIRLRDLGGIIVIDFIDMDERKNRQKVMQALEEAMRSDRAPYKILQFNDFGLVAITRKRVKQSLERTLCSPCPACEGAGYVKSVQTIVAEILQEAVKLRKVVEGKDVMLRTHPDVAKFLKSNTNKYLEELEEILGRPVLVTSDPALNQEKFDLA